jgi:hypothetical protein
MHSTVKEGTLENRSGTKLIDPIIGYGYQRIGIEIQSSCENQHVFFQGKRVFLVLSKKIDSRTIIDVLKREGRLGRYELVRPAG